MNPDAIHPLLDKSVQEKARCYEKEKHLIGLSKLFALLVIILAFYFSGFSQQLAHIYPDRSVILAFSIYVFFFQAIIFLWTLPFDFYSSYSHEHKWGFSNQSISNWLVEQGKSFFVSLVIMWIVLGLLFFIMSRFPSVWWLIAGLASALVSVVFSTLFPIIVLPIFHKYTSIRNKNLKEALNAILSKEGLKSSGFFMEDMSRKTKKENAFLAGLGKTRRVVLGDNLVDNMSVPEIVSVVAHEVGHYKYKHIWKFIIIGTFQQVVVFYLLNGVMRAFSPDFLTGIRENLNLFPLFVLFLSAISTFLSSPIGNALSRSFEEQADQYALEQIKDHKSFSNAIAGLANRNLINAYPKKWIKFLFYSHPPVGERLEKAER
ncbi:MAG: M48 family metalloprotease [Candidatus Aminicenantes bacterium]|nr:M48 family metalloprotease [Candidatus Aminicenantes bacterium]